MPAIRIERVTLNTLTYTAIRAPRPCSRVRITNEDGTATITVRSDATDAGGLADVESTGAGAIGTTQYIAVRVPNVTPTEAMVWTFEVR